MPQPHHLRRLAIVAEAFFAICFATAALSAQKLPPTPPTSLPTSTAPSAVQTVTPAPNPAMHAEVIYTNGQLQIRADNSSLNQILRSISHVTGLKITGGVEEQRVFGSYGPAPLSTILATLLDGTGANILLLSGNSGTPPELVLTSRTGGPDLPGPNSPAYAMYDDASDRANPVPSASSRAPTVPNSVVSPSATTPPITVTPPTAAAAGKVLTPEMVEQELLQMQAAQDRRKKELDDKIQQQQAEQNKKLGGKIRTQPNPPPAGSTPPQ